MSTDATAAMTVDALMTLAQKMAAAWLENQSSRVVAAYDDGNAAKELRTAIEQYGREQGFESTAQRDVREACYELRDALGNPVISGTGDQTIQGQTIRMAAARLRGSGAPVALDTEPANRVPNQEPTHQRERTDTMTPTDEKPLLLVRGGRYNWLGQADRLIYLGVFNGWHQFKKIGDPRKVWCEVLDEELRMIEETKDD